jgi:hydrogenase nickel incorporation protein HypA/HybF
MHELPITENLLAITLRHATTAQATRVLRVHCAIGQLSSIVDDSVQFYWNLIAKDTIAAGATLTFKRVPATFRCLACQAAFNLHQQQDFTCPHCGSLDVMITGGDDLRLDSIEVE